MITFKFNYFYINLKLFIYKFILIFIIIIIIINEFFYSILSYHKISSQNKSIWKESFSNFNICEINDSKDRQLYLKNKTLFYLKLRTKFLSKSNTVYNESKIATIQDKLSWLDIHESPQYKSFVVDKIKLRDYSKKILGKGICVPILKIYDNINELNFNDLPTKFVMKFNHGSLMNIICEDKQKLNMTIIKKKSNNWKNSNYGLYTTEFQYMFVKRRILVEKFLTKDIIDYKILYYLLLPYFCCNLVDYQ